MAVKAGSKSHYIQILRDQGIQDEITEVDIVVPELHGAHFASSCDYVTVHRKEGGGPIELFTKRLVDNAEYAKKLTEMKVFEKEAGFFNSLLPDLKKFVKTKAGSQYNLDIAPKCYFANEELIVMENLAKQGYIMLDKMERQSLEQAQIVIKSLARLHAPSYVLLTQEVSAPELREKYPCLQEMMLSKKNEPVMNEMFVPMLGLISLMLKAHPTEETDFAVKLLGEFSAGLVDKLEPALAESKRVGSVVNHGDCWNNNMLFREDPITKKLIDHILIDFQVVRIGSPNLDLAYYLFTSVKAEVRRGEWLNILRLYYDSLVENVTTLKGRVTFSYEDLVEDYKERFILGFLFGVFMSSAMDAMGSLGNLDELQGDILENMERVTKHWIANNPKKVEENVEELRYVFREYKELLNL